MKTAAILLLGWVLLAAPAVPAKAQANAPVRRAAHPAVATGAQISEQLRGFRLEPGFRLADRRLLIPLIALDEQGQPLAAPAAASLRCEVAGAAVAVLALDETVPTAILVVSDQFLVSAAWAQTDVLAPLSPHWLGIWDAASTPRSHLALKPAAGLPLPAGLAAPTSPRVWDAVLAGIKELAVLDGAPLRRVILVVGDLREEDQSNHPMAACLEASRDLAIPVYGGLVTGTDPTAAERLRHLAAAAGGAVVETASPLAALVAGLRQISAARGLTLTDPGAAVPAAVTVAAGVGTTPASTQIVERPRGRFTPGSGLILAAVVVLSAAGGLGGWRLWRRRPVGYLLPVDPAAGWRQAIPAAGLTIGRTTDNGLALDEKRVSKHHAQVRWHRGHVQLIDLRSTNGTQIGGRPVRTAVLNDGDTIVFGDAVAVQFQRRAPRWRDRA